VEFQEAAVLLLKVVLLGMMEKILKFQKKVKQSKERDQVAGRILQVIENQLHLQDQGREITMAQAEEVREVHRVRVDRQEVIVRRLHLIQVQATVLRLHQHRAEGAILHRDQAAAVAAEVAAAEAAEAEIDRADSSSVISL